MAATLNRADRQGKGGQHPCSSGVRTLRSGDGDGQAADCISTVIQFITPYLNFSGILLSSTSVVDGDVLVVR